VTRQVLLILVYLLHELHGFLHLRGIFVEEASFVLVGGGLDVAALLVGVLGHDMESEVVEALFFVIADGAKD